MLHVFAVAYADRASQKKNAGNWKVPRLSSQKRQGTHKDRVGPLILVQVSIQDNIHSIIIQHLLHGLTHALILQVVSGVCMQATHVLTYRYGSQIGT